jgi:hypothetical protein
MLALIVQHRSHRRSRTSGEYLFVVLLMIVHLNQELEPPANPERFRIAPTNAKSER